MKIRKIALIGFLAFAVAACGGTTTVGSEDFQVGGGSRLEDEFRGGESPEATPTAQETRRQNNNDNNNRRDDEPKEEDRVSVRFAITADGFDPYFIRVFAGGLVMVENKDSQPRSVRATDGSFDSGLIQPGDSWIYEANIPGKYDLNDGTRPYVVGTLEVIAR